MEAREEGRLAHKHVGRGGGLRAVVPEKGWNWVEDMMASRRECAGDRACAWRVIGFQTAHDAPRCRSGPAGPTGRIGNAGGRGGAPWGSQDAKFQCWQPSPMQTCISAC